MANSARRLYTLDYPLNTEQMGKVYVYPLTADFATLWDRLAKRWDRKEGFKTPHASLRTALATVNGRMVILTVRRNTHNEEPLSRRSLLVSDGPLDPQRTRICFDVWQRLSYGTYRNDDRLSHFIDFEAAKALPLMSVLERDDAGYITGPWWWKDAVGWSAIRLLAPHPLLDQAREDSITQFRPSTGRILVAWDYPLHYTTNKGRKNERTEYGMAYVSAVGTTMRGHPDPIVRIDCHTTRVAPTYKNVKTVHVRHPNFPTLLRVPVRSLPRKDANGDEVVDNEGNMVWDTTFRGHTAEIVQACGLEPITLPDKADGDLDHVRPVFRNKGKHKIGKGAGAYFTLRMATHISDVLGTEPLIYDATSYNIPGNSIIGGPVPLGQLAEAVTHAGWRSLRLAILYAKDSTPRRILKILETDYGVSIPLGLTRADSSFDGAEFDISPGVTLVMCKAPELVMHGTHDRSAIIDQVPCLKPTGADQLISAICETNWDGKRAKNDGKFPTRQALAQAGITSQFLNAAKQDEEETDSKDHPASSAIRNLLQNSGIVDNRVSFATSAVPQTRKKSPLTEPVTVVGLYFRRHNYKRVRGQSLKPPKLVVLLVALHLGTDPYTPPRLEMYDNGHWLRHAEGVTAFHAGSIGQERWGRDGEGAHEVRLHIEAALDSLILPTETERVVLVVDKEGSQSIYPALGDNPSVTGPFPGRGLVEDGLDVAIARIALGEHAPRPATAYREGVDDLRMMQPSYRKRILFAYGQGDETSWLLTQDSRQHQGAKSPQRLGTTRMRDHFHESPVPSHMAKDMHATSRIEITIPKKGNWEPADLAVLIARMCDQAVAWDHRTLRPVPLHLAHAADRDHPEFGDHDPGGEADEDEVPDFGEA
ncbi:RNaseH domain-containing protein [Nocardiopsis sp. FR6]|uniref:RNaseH domain-containing protein n=1 Tax=Nocardiopsis sp. FR6 TaxID=2605986 RepID=UPI00135BB2AF|nr:RNaseH domain-containing protein [Nocardiopsis sp. FR6]